MPASLAALRMPVVMMHETRPQQAMSTPRTQPPGVPFDVEQRIRAHGAVLDMAFTQSIYTPLLKLQRRDGVDVDRDLVYGDDTRHRVDVYRPQQALQYSVRPQHGVGLIDC